MTIKTIIEENKKKAELSIFWQEMSTYLPKTLEREELGDSKIFQAFALTYPSIKKYLLSTLLDEIEKQVETNKKPRLPENIYMGNYKDMSDAGYNQAIEEVLSILNKYR